MSWTVRTITADCASGDGSQLIISTEGQAEDQALQFTVKPGEGVEPPCVRIGIQELAELIGFQNLESARYNAEWRSDDDDEEEFE